MATSPVPIFNFTKIRAIQTPATLPTILETTMDPLIEEMLRNSTEGMEEDEETFHMASFYCACIMVTLCVIGLLGNLLSIHVFSRRSMRTSSINILLTGLSATDFLLLLVVVPIFALPALSNSGDAGFMDFMQVMTVYAYPIALILQTSSVWIFLLITTERFLAVCFPLKVGYYCTVSKAKIGLGIVILLASIYNLVRFWEYKLMGCPEEYRELKICFEYVAGPNLKANRTYWLWYGTIAYCATQFLVPVLVIAVLNGMVIYKMYQARKLRALLSSSEKSEHRTAVMMIIVVVEFICCYALSFLLNIYEAVDPNVFDTEEPTSASFYLMGDISNTLVVLNSATTFLIYLGFSRRYRYIVRTLLLKCLPRKLLQEYFPEETLGMMENRKTFQYYSVMPTPSRNKSGGRDGASLMGNSRNASYQDINLLSLNGPNANCRSQSTKKLIMESASTPDFLSPTKTVNSYSTNSRNSSTLSPDRKATLAEPEAFSSPESNRNTPNIIRPSNDPKGGQEGLIYSPSPDSHLLSPYAAIFQPTQSPTPTAIKPDSKRKSPEKLSIFNRRRKSSKNSPVTEMKTSAEEASLLKPDISHSLSSGQKHPNTDAQRLLDVNKFAKSLEDEMLLAKNSNSENIPQPDPIKNSETRNSKRSHKFPVSKSDLYLSDHPEPSQSATRTDCQFLFPNSHLSPKVSSLKGSRRDNSCLPNSARGDYCRNSSKPSPGTYRNPVEIHSQTRTGNDAGGSLHGSPLHSAYPRDVNPHFPENNRCMSVVRFSEAVSVDNLRDSKFKKNWKDRFLLNFDHSNRRSNSNQRTNDDFLSHADARRTSSVRSNKGLLQDISIFFGRSNSQDSIPDYDVSNPTVL